MNQTNLVFPLFVNLSEKHIVVIGAGKIATRRIRSLLGFAGKITVVSIFRASFRKKRLLLV